MAVIFHVMVGWVDGAVMWVEIVKDMDYYLGCVTDSSRYAGVVGDAQTINFLRHALSCQVDLQSDLRWAVGES